MADEKVNVSPEEKKAPEAPAPSGPGDPPAPKHTEGPAVPGGDQTAPAHVEPAMPEKRRGPSSQSSLLSLVWVRTLPHRPAR